MRYTAVILSLFIFFFCSPFPAFADNNSEIELFSPQGTVKNVRQASVRFSAQMVSFGDPRLDDPFDITCPEKGKGRWADGRNWIYDFEKDLPAGMVCKFNAKKDVKSLSGKRLTGQTAFSFSTGGPAIRESDPYEGAEQIDEDQIFVLTLDAEADEKTVLSNVSCIAEGINERIGIIIVKGEERERVLKLHYSENKNLPKIVVRCRQRFPNESQIRLVWGKGVQTLSGVATTEDQVLAFKTRRPFIATFRCTRENAQAECIPILSMYLHFSASVAWETARKIVLRGPAEKTYAPAKPNDENVEFVYSVSFQGPFPENASFSVEIPGEIKDDAGRKLENSAKFPLQVKTDAYPPLAKFSGRFGIIELNAGALLPVTLRNIEPSIQSMMLKVEGKKGEIAEKAKAEATDKTVKKGEYVEGVKGVLHKVPMEKEEKVIEWMKKVAAARREASILLHESGKKDFSIPKSGGGKDFEVIGIPLKAPGFYVVELESRLLGASLLGEQKPMYVPTGALVTNLSAHFKWGRESSLVWVTTLDTAQPVANAAVSVRDCSGKLIWSGKTNNDGIAKINAELALQEKLSRCPVDINYGEASHMLSGISGGLFIFARTPGDMTFVHSSWDNGIEPWRFNLPSAPYKGPVIAHTIFDRSLLRAGDALHMKHIIRKHTMTGFSLLKEPGLPKTVMIQHIGSDQRYEFPLKWNASGMAETEWKIPREAKLGSYEVMLLAKKAEKPKARAAVGGYEEGDDEYFSPDGWTSGSFRVEEFRVPLMKAILQPPKEQQVNPQKVDVDILVQYLSGGGAGKAPVKLRSQVQPRYVHSDDYDGFVFANGEIKEGITSRTDYEGMEEQAVQRPKVQTKELILDTAGSSRTTISDIPHLTAPQTLLTELEFRDPNGEVQTASTRIPLWPSKVVAGIKPDSWASSKEHFTFHVAVLDLSGKPVSDVLVKTELFQRKYYTHRKRLIGGFYSYEHVTEIKRIGQMCEGKTNAKGLLICEGVSPVSGNVLLQAIAADEDGNLSLANTSVWIAGEKEWWFDVSDSDRIDLLPEKKRYEPGETARFQVRMPFREATALITVEREGIIETSIKKLSGKTPSLEIPVKGSYAPNVFVSALVMRGRSGDVQPTAIVDLGRPAYKLGIAEINVGWRAHELKVHVSAEQSVYKIREKAKVYVKVKRADGKAPPKGSEVAIAAVDEGLLELMGNDSWRLLDAMMGRRGYEIQTSTAQMQVVGKRHFGLKALPQGGGGGRQITRELFDTLLVWKARVPLNERGEAMADIPLNDSLTSFRIVAVASGGVGLFGSGETSIRTTQDVMVLSGIPPLVREGDLFSAGFTVRNASSRNMNLTIHANVSSSLGKNKLDAKEETLAAGEAKELFWLVRAPYGIESLQYEVKAEEKNGKGQDSLAVSQKVAEAVPTRVVQATLSQIEKILSFDIEKPADAIQEKGGLSLILRPKLSNGLGGVQWFMKRYPYSCIEQKVSKAIALRDESQWQRIISELPAHLDADGLAKYFPTCLRGSDTLTSYILSVSHEAGWEVPQEIRVRMEDGLLGFIEGRVIRYSSLPAADLSIRKMAALEALSRNGRAEPKLLGSIAIEPNLWPTSAVLDWTNVLVRMKDIPQRQDMLKEAEQIISARLNFQGTTMGFSTEHSDNLWWLMTNTDVNSVKSILTLLNFGNWKEDMPRLMRGALHRQYRGAWITTTANAWGVLASEKFSNTFEAIPVTGITDAHIGNNNKNIEWTKTPEGGSMLFDWPKQKERLSVAHQGSGRPWATFQSLAAIPLKGPFSSGYTIRKTLTPLEQKAKGRWSRGDLVRVHLDLEAQSDMTWVVMNDPIPAGASVLGTGLGRDSQILTQDEETKGWVWPVFEERSFEAYRVYYEFVPKGKWTVEYTVRLNNEGTFLLPPTRVEALYAPELFGEIPNETIEIGK